MARNLRGKRRLAVDDHGVHRIADTVVAAPLMRFMATPTVLVNFDKLPDAAVMEIVSQHGLNGDRKGALKGLQDIVHRSTYAELDPIIGTIKAVAAKHGVPEAVQDHSHD